MWVARHTCPISPIRWRISSTRQHEGVAADRRIRNTGNASVLRRLEASRWCFFGVPAIFSRVLSFLASGFYPVSYHVWSKQPFWIKLACDQAAWSSPARKEISECLTSHSQQHGIQQWRDLVRGWQSGLLSQFLQRRMHIAFFPREFHFSVL